MMNDDDIAAVMEILWESSEAKSQEVLNYTKERAERLAALVAPLISEARTDALEFCSMTADREAAIEIMAQALTGKQSPQLIDDRRDELLHVMRREAAIAFDALVASGALRPVADAQAEALEAAAQIAERYDKGYSQHPNDRVVDWAKERIAAQIRALATATRTPASPEEGNN